MLLKEHILSFKRRPFLRGGIIENDIFIGVGRFRIMGGGARFGILGRGGQGGPNSQQAHNVVLTSMRRNDFAHRRHFGVMCPLGFS